MFNSVFFINSIAEAAFSLLALGTFLALRGVSRCHGCGSSGWIRITRAMEYYYDFHWG